MPTGTPYTREEQHTINTGNVMLSQAGMPLMTREQEWAFIQKQRAKKGYHAGGAPDAAARSIDVIGIAGLALLAIPAYLLYRALKK